MCRKINDSHSLERLVEKHGQTFLDIKKQYSELSIINEYSKFPDLWILTDRIDPSLVPTIIQQTKDNDYGWSLKGVFLGNWNLKTLEEHDEPIFQNPSKVLDVFYHIFGKLYFCGCEKFDYCILSFLFL